MNGTTPHIVQYQGSKRNLAPQIRQYIPKRFNRLVEPFAGMAAIAIAVSKQRRAERYFLNDLNEPLVNVLKESITNPQQLIEDYTKIWSEQLTYQGGSVEHFYKVRNDFNNGNQCAANMLYLLARCVKGSVRYSSSGQFNQSPDKRRMGTNPKNLARNVLLISKYLKDKTDFSSVDYRDVLEMWFTWILLIKEYAPHETADIFPASISMTLLNVLRISTEEELILLSAMTVHVVTSDMALIYRKN